MKRLSVVTLCLTLLGATCGNAAFGQVTVTGGTLGFDKAGSNPRPGTYTAPTSDVRWELTAKP